MVPSRLDECSGNAKDAEWAKFLLSREFNKVEVRTAVERPPLVGWDIDLPALFHAGFAAQYSTATRFFGFESGRCESVSEFLPQWVRRVWAASSKTRMVSSLIPQYLKVTTTLLTFIANPTE